MVDEYKTMFEKWRNETKLQAYNERKEPYKKSSILDILESDENPYSRMPSRGPSREDFDPRGPGNPF